MLAEWFVKKWRALPGSCHAARPEKRLVCFCRDLQSPAARTQHCQALPFSCLALGVTFYHPGLQVDAADITSLKLLPCPRLCWQDGCPHGKRAPAALVVCLDAELAGPAQLGVLGGLLLPSGARTCCYIGLCAFRTQLGVNCILTYFCYEYTHKNDSFLCYLAAND